MTGGKVSDWSTKAFFVPLIDRWGKEQEVLVYSLRTITSPIEEVDLRPALREFPKLGNDYWKIQRPMGDVDLLIGTNDARLHPHLANPDEHRKGNLRLMTSQFGTGYLIDGSHPNVKVGPHRANPEGTRDAYEFRKPRGFKRRPRTSHHSSVAISKVQECMEPDVESKGRPSGGNSATSVSASSLRSATSTSNQGTSVGQRKGKRSENVVFDRSCVSSSTRSRKVAPTISKMRSQTAAGHRQVSLVPADEGQPEAQDQQGHAEVHAVSRSRGNPLKWGLPMTSLVGRSSRRNSSPR